MFGVVRAARLHANVESTHVIDEALLDEENDEVAEIEGDESYLARAP